jgi:SpoVK/Ycf46/Vps4 family AAA+-type ATPase
LIYVPPDMAKEISSPAFLPFLMEYQDAILIIEDAENIIRDRSESSTPSQAVANLLNLCVSLTRLRGHLIRFFFFRRSDGLLGDAMHQQIIATFNCDLTTIDPALLRKGRLIANYEFNKLDLNSSKILSDKLGFGTENITESMTLAEIYNQGGNEDTEASA